MNVNEVKKPTPNKVGFLFLISIFLYNTLAELSAGISKLGTFEERNNDIDLNELTPNKWYLIGTSNANKPEGTMSELAFVKTEHVGGG